VSNDGVINEMERMWKETVVAYFKVPSLNLAGGTEEKHETPKSG
jgi:hypothetical protein